MDRDTPTPLRQVLLESFGNLHEAVAAVTRAARAVVLAHLDSLDDRPYRVRARAGHFRHRLEEEFGAPGEGEPPWKAAVSLLGRGYGGVTLAEGSEWVWLKEGRTVFGTSRRFIPTVFQLVRRVLGEVMPRALMHDLYRRELRQQYQLDD